jgi:glycosyltransferase involved in cell wall biosynthesis
MKSEEAQIKGPRLEKPIRITEQVWPEGTVPVVSVFSWTYNHAQFIRESIESILMQETTFPVEIIIHDDASNDGTAEIIREYESKHPQLFRNILHAENQMSQDKSVMEPLFTAPHGKFMALTHGDDFWTKAEKLEKQVSFLEQNPGYALSFCNTQVVYMDERISHAAYGNHLVPLGYYPVSPTPPDTTKIENLSKSNYIHTSGAVFRNWLRADNLEVRKYLDRVPVGDYALHLLSSRIGKIKYHPETMAAYRVHSGGVHSMLPYFKKALTGALFYQISARSCVFDRNIAQVWMERSAKVSAEAVIYSDFDGWDAKFTAMSSDPEWVTNFLEEIRSIHQRELNRCDNGYRNSASFRLGRSLLKPWKLIKKWFF